MSCDLTSAHTYIGFLFCPEHNLIMVMLRPKSVVYVYVYNHDEWVRQLNVALHDTYVICSSKITLALSFILV